jgi:hypothetical protein
MERKMGGARKGAGRKSTGRIKCNFTLPPELKVWLDTYAVEVGLPISYVLDNAIRSYRDEVLKDLMSK